MDVNRNNNPGHSGFFIVGIVTFFHPEDGKKATTVMHKDAFCCKSAYILLFTLSVKLRSSDQATFFLVFVVQVVFFILKDVAYIQSKKKDLDAVLAASSLSSILRFI